MRKALLIAAGVVLCTILFFGACSKDKNTNPAMTQGNPNDERYQEAQQVASLFVDSLGIFAVDGFNLMNFDGTGMPKVASDSISIDFNDATYWWVIYECEDTTSFNCTSRDSIRFEMGSGYSRLPDTATTTGVDYRGRLAFDCGLDSTSIGTDIVRLVHMTGIQSELFVFNGQTSADLTIDYGATSVQEIYSATERDITFNRSDLEGGGRAHPVSGSLDMALTVHQVTPQGSSNVNWTINATFYIDHVHIHFESGNNYWDWDHPYNG